MSKDPSDQIIDDREAGRSSGVGDNPWDKLTGKFGDEDSASYGADDLDTLFIPEGKREAYIKEELLAHLKVAKREIICLGWQEDPNQLILYPGSNSDRTMAEVFGNQVVHIDPDGNALVLLKNKGFPTEQMTIEDFIANMSDGEKIGIILSYNAGLVPDSALERLQEGGIILANNWHGSADDLHSKKGLELIGAVVQDTEDFVTVQAAESLLGKVQYLDNGPNGYVNYDPTQKSN
ncbi:hypothetical protein EUA75_03230 [TM7 phylum sp. oral taxon 353]|nr:hypothetical protein EUA75_03230 [TM7 phylum sp. oral taxon 353]